MFLENLQSIKSMFVPMALPAEVLTPGESVDVEAGTGEVPAGTGVEVDGESGKPISTDVNVDEPTVETPPVAEEAEEPVSFEYNGNTYSAEDMEAALEATANKAKWEGDLHQKAADLNEVARSLEASRQNYHRQPEPSEAVPQEMLTGQQLKDMILDTPDQAVDAITNLVKQITSAQVGSASDARTVQDHFNSAHPEFNQVVGSAEFASYLGTLPQASNGQPIYGNANAFLSYQLSKARGEIETAKKQGFMEGEKTTEKNIKAAGKIRLIRGSGAGQPAALKPDIKSMSQEEVLNAATAAVLLSRKTNGG